jgi:fucose 4-O-acetylase-like acetyltransferase
MLTAMDEQPMMTSPRDSRLDVLKALAIGLVILGHTITLVYGRPTDAPVWLAAAFTVFSSFHVPLFVFVSGYLARADAGLDWIGNRALRLLVPFFAWALLQWVVFFSDQGVVWLRRIVAFPGRTNALWFLYVLFELCVLYVLFKRSTPLLVVAAALCLLVSPAVGVKWGLSYVVMLFPVFVAGRLAAMRRFEPGAWVIPLAAVLLAALWTTPGANLLWGTPAWATSFGSGTVGWLIDPVAVLVRALRLALQLSLVGSAFYLARGASRGAWLGALTLGTYCAHPFFMPAWAGGKGVVGLLAAFVITCAGAVGAALLLRRWETASLLLLGSGVLPRWTRLLRSTDPS